ncbi:hypothetical protein [Actinomadura decatromicini]|nr:hypothetical protein [Actinomadura decatromicini]
MAVILAEMGLDLAGLATARSLSHALQILALGSIPPPRSAEAASQDPA